MGCCALFAVLLVFSPGTGSKNLQHVAPPNHAGLDHDQRLAFSLGAKSKCTEQGDGAEKLEAAEWQ